MGERRGEERKEGGRRPERKHLSYSSFRDFVPRSQRVTLSGRIVQCYPASTPRSRIFFFFFFSLECSHEKGGGFSVSSGVMYGYIRSTVQYARRTLCTYCTTVGLTLHQNLVKSGRQPRRSGSLHPRLSCAHRASSTCLSGRRGKKKMLSSRTLDLFR